MNIDQIELLIKNGFISMRQEEATIESRIKTLEVMAGILKQEAVNLKNNQIEQVELNTIS
jgi:hypothetical protein